MTEKLWDNYSAESIKNNILKIRTLADGYGAIVCAATKTVPVGVVNYALDNGLDYMGENRVQELIDKYPELHSDREHIHFIGRLQTNKVKYIVGKVGLIHSLDSLSLAEEISKRSLKLGTVTDCLCEINIGNEESKGGIPADECERFIESVGSLSGIRIAGIMSIGPHEETKEAYIPYMKEVRSLFVSLSGRHLLGDDPQLSMGMSDNYDLALEYGSTIIRPGTAIFGRREYK